MIMIDAQVHIWAADTPQRVFWGMDLTPLPCPYRQALTLFTVCSTPVQKHLPMLPPQPCLQRLLPG